MIVKVAKLFTVTVGDYES